jgi:SEL1 protein
MALQSSVDAYLPVVLSLAKLYVRSAWHTLNGGTDGLRLWPGDEDGARLFLSLLSRSLLTRTSEEVYEGKGHPPRARALDAAADGAAPAQTTPQAGADRRQKADAPPEDKRDDGPWYRGKAREQFERARQRRAGAPYADDGDAVEVRTISLSLSPPILVLNRRALS